MSWQVLAQRLANELADQGIRDIRVLQRIASIPRHLFLEDPNSEAAYDDRALPIAGGQTISQPYIVALMTEAAQISPGDRVLEVGTGSGYQAAILSGLCAELITIERLPQLTEHARARWHQLGLTNITSVIGDGSLGWPEFAPYHAILVTAGAPQVPGVLLDQLADGGRLVIPVGPLEQQELMVYRRCGDTYESWKLCDCRFVKLLGNLGWSGTDDPTQDAEMT